MLKNISAVREKFVEHPTVPMTTQMLVEIRKAAFEDGASVSELIRRMLRAALDARKEGNDGKLRT